MLELRKGAAPLAGLILLLLGGAAWAAPGSVAEATQHLQAGMNAAAANRWDAALAEYSASNAAAPSVAALDGLANAHYQLHHDPEARAAYASLLAMNVQIPANEVALQQSWARMRATAQERVAAIDARAQASAAPPAPVAPPRDRAAGEEDEHPKPVERTAHNAIFLEIAGNGLLYSVNYERLFGDSDFSVRAGFSFISIGASGGGASARATLMTFPILGNYYVGGKNHKLQLGAGVTLMYASESAGSGGVGVASVSGLVPAPTLAIGYRYLPSDGGFSFFIGFTPFIVPGGDKPILPWAGMSFGGVI